MIRALAEWQHQEDAALVTALVAEEADMQHRHDDDLRTITNGFIVDLESLGIMVHSDGWDDVSAMLEMKRLKEVATMRRFHGDTAVIHTAKAQWQGNARVTALAALPCREDAAQRTPRRSPLWPPRQLGWPPSRRPCLAMKGLGASTPPWHPSKRCNGMALRRRRPALRRWLRGRPPMTNDKQI